MTRFSTAHAHCLRGPSRTRSVGPRARVSGPVGGVKQRLSGGISPLSLLHDRSGSLKKPEAMNNSSQFPAPSSQQRVSAATTTSGRNKVQLKPGRSLMDWIRLIKSGRDMTGLKGRFIEVTPEELAKHNTKTDCWICIRGLVYNVTSYLEYHPGGEEELMKGAGADATELFDQIHSWVNYNSMLKECLVGRMSSKPIYAAKVSVKQPGLTVQRETLLNGATVTDGLEKRPRDISPRYEWFQTEDTITIVIYTKQKDINSDSVIVDLEGSVLRTEVRQEEHSYILHLELSHEVVQESTSVRCRNKVGKIELHLKKVNNTVWNDLGQPQEHHNTYEKNANRDLFYRKCSLISKVDVSHNTRLFCFQLPPGCHLTVPVGQHVYLKSCIQDVEVIRPYTAVLPALYPEPKNDDQSYANIYLMIKIYPDGLLTPIIDKLQIGDSVSLSSPDGNFKCTQLKGITELILLAAGTGFTPMIKLIGFAFKFSYFRFQVEYILSEPHSEWTGKRGKIEMSLCSELVARRTEEGKSLVCVCGPTSFTEQVVRFCTELGITNEEIHAFTA
ncbi:cytochrome b5 reductase 4 isoform X2 [Hypanus sabinus]|uniref:cytochrome b5 reductase 4 isoform X2 n=1 Tax=Hypanus sabinus TaxID=79690 RepID=UPI0028C45164|nr:cytochrome b5 reductase 4 isoform X2 [Hypanus sabinus]